MDFLTILVSFFSQYGYFSVFAILVLCGFGLPVPEDITLVSGGVISGLEYTNVHIMFGVGMAGVLFGDSVMFMAGLTFGESILKNPFIAKIVTPKRYEKVQEQFEKYGRWVVFMARFMPGLRTPIYITTGATKKVNFPIFFITDFLAAIISVPLWVYLGYLGAHNFDLLNKWIHQGQMTIFILLGIAIIAFGIYIYFKNKYKINQDASID